MIGVYFQTWSSQWSSNPASLDLANVAGYDIIYLAFVTPNCTYVKGSTSWGGTGLDFSSDFLVVKSAIGSLVSKGIKVVLSVGGATYPYDGFTSLNAQCIADLARDLECTGIDIDWEPSGGASQANQLSGIIDTFYSVGNNLTLSLASFSIGCFGYGNFVNNQPQGSNTGMNYPGIVASGNKLNWINLMSYDASPVYDPIAGFNSVRAVFNGPILIGVENAPQAWGGFEPTDNDIINWANYASKNNGGMFVWSLQKQGTPNITNIYNDIVNGMKGTGNVNVPVVKVPVVVPKVPPSVPAPQPTIPDTDDSGIVAWQPGIHVVVGELVSFEGKIYTVIQSHNTQSDWPPNIVPALFSLNV